MQEKSEVCFCNYVLFLIFAGSDVVYIAERLFSSSLVALVSQAAPRKLRVCHFKKGTEICNYSYTGKIISVKMNRAVRRTHRVEFLAKNMNSLR